MLLIHITMNLKYWYIIHVKNIWIISWRQPYDTSHWWPGNPGWLGPCIPTILLALVPIVTSWITTHKNVQIWRNPQVRQLHLLHVSSSHQLRPKVEVLTLSLEKSFFRARKGFCWPTSCFCGSPARDRGWWSCEPSSSSTGRCWTQLLALCCMSSSTPLPA